MDIGDIFNLLSPLLWKYATHILSLLSSLEWTHENRALNFGLDI